MNAERLLACYEQVADAPDAVARLRRFIRDLAVRGKLVPHDMYDESVSELLERRRISFSSTGLFELPRTWAWVRVGAVSETRLGKMLDKNKNKGTLRPYLRNINVRWFGFDLSNLLMMPFEAAELEEFSLQVGDVLICEGGEPGRAAVWDERTRDIYFQKALHRVRFAGFVDPMFFVNALKSSAEEGRLAEYFTGSGIKHFTGRSLDNYLFPLPPLAEQYRIVAKVDELMDLCDRLEAARMDRETVRDRLAAASLGRLNAPETTVPAAATSPMPEASHAFADHARFVLDALPALTVRPDQIRSLRQTILNLAVRGKLVPQNAKDEPASKLLDRIAKDKAARAVSARDRRATTIKPLFDAEAPFPLPASWLWASFGDITISRDSERVPVSREERAQKSKIYDYYGASGIIDKIDGYLFDKPLLLIGEDGANLINRSTPIAFIAQGEYWVNNHAHVLDGISESFLQYLNLFINATDLRPYVTGTAQPKMNQAKMNNIPVALPPLAEQHRIVAKVDALMALCDKLEASLTAAADTRRRLLDALLAEALAPDEDRLLEAAE